MLITIARHMNANYEAWPGQEKLAQELGISVTTVSDHIRRLLKFRWNGQPLITARKHPRWGNYVYRFNPMCQLACGKNGPTPIEPEKNPAPKQKSNGDGMALARRAKADKREPSRPEEDS
jgi:hypothetical protein